MASLATRIVRRLRGEVYYFFHAMRVLARPVIGLVLVWLIGAAIQQQATGGDFAHSLFVSYCLLFFEHIDDPPPDALATIVHYVQPLFGVLLVSEGILRLAVDLLERRHNNRIWIDIMASSTQNHVIVCGLGTVGFRVAEELLALGLEVFAIERDEDGAFVERARAAGVRVLIGDARAETELARLNVEDARAVIVATDDDLANLEVAMDVRRLNENVPIVLRMFDQRLAEKVRETLGVQVSMSTSRIAAPLFASSALDPAVVGIHRVGDRTLVVLDLVLKSEGALVGRSVADAAREGLNVIAQRRDGTWSSPPAPDTVLEPGDEIHLLVPSERADEGHRLASGM